jgi:hypothetical protein
VQLLLEIWPGLLGLPGLKKAEQAGRSSFALDLLYAIITMTCVSRARNCIKLQELVLALMQVA